MTIDATVHRCCSWQHIACANNFFDLHTDTACNSCIRQRIRIPLDREGTSRQTAQAREIIEYDKHEPEATRSDMVVLTTNKCTAPLSTIHRWQHWGHCPSKARNTAKGARILLKNITADRSQKRCILLQPEECLSRSSASISFPTRH